MLTVTTIVRLFSRPAMESEPGLSKMDLVVRSRRYCQRNTRSNSRGWCRPLISWLHLNKSRKRLLDSDHYQFEMSVHPRCGATAGVVDRSAQESSLDDAGCVHRIVEPDLPNWLRRDP